MDAQNWKGILDIHYLPPAARPCELAQASLRGLDGCSKHKSAAGFSTGGCPVAFAKQIVHQVSVGVSVAMLSTTSGDQPGRLGHQTSSRTVHIATEFETQIDIVNLII